MSIGADGLTSARLYIGDFGEGTISGDYVADTITVSGGTLIRK